MTIVNSESNICRWINLNLTDSKRVIQVDQDNGIEKPVILSIQNN